MRIYTPLYKWLTSTPLRYSKPFVYLQNIIQLSGEEIILKHTMQYIRANKVEGDYLEFGVFEGDSFIRAYKFAKMQDLKMNFYAFDSFEGLPQAEGVDADFAQWKTGHVSCSLKKFEKRIFKHMNKNEVGIASGWFKETLNKETKKQLGIKKAAVVMVDCDLYNSTVPVMNFITDYVQDGMILIFSDWFCYRGDPNRGEQRAFGEWLKRNPNVTATELERCSPHGLSFILHKGKNEK